MCEHLRYTREIPEHAPFLFRHEAQTGCLRVFPVIKITVARRVFVTRIYCGLSVKMYTCKMMHCTRKLFLCVCGRQNQKKKTPIWAPWLTMPFHGAVYKAWDLPCISVVNSDITLEYWSDELINAVFDSPVCIPVPLEWDTLLLLPGCSHQSTQTDNETCWCVDHQHQHRCSRSHQHSVTWRMEIFK